MLTFDFGLKREIEELGGEAAYIDSLCKPSEMQKNNFLSSDFFKKWHYDKFGNDIFTAQEIPFGFSFRIEIWSEYLYYVRLRANLEQLRKLQYETIYLGETGGFVENILHEMGISFVTLNSSLTLKKTAYFFDIHQYMHDALHRKSIRNFAKDALVKILSNVSFYIDRIFQSKPNQKTVYAQIYHPTKKIVESLQKDSSVRVVTSSLSANRGLKKYFVQRLIPINGRKVKFQKQAELLLNNFKNNRCALLCLSDGTDITAGAYNIIEQQIQQTVPEALRILNSVINYIKKQPIHLEIMIANIGLVQTIVDCVLKTKQIPSYLIINGLLGGKFCDEAKYGTFINSYSESIKKYYFDDASNVVCLGDPRMDDYITRTKLEPINRVAPTVSIGTSGFNNIDLISYVAIEFDFMFDILSAFQEIQDEGGAFNLIIKVRPNGVLEQYTAFASEYFPKLNIEIVREVPISEVLMKTDLYISIYSQTLFEASCLGIPVIYYKKDQEILDPPFDKKSELVTVDTIAGLKQAFFDFKTGHDRFNVFLEKPVMEKYVGPLDGKNLERNLAFIYDLLDNTEAGVTH
ncbi:MAG: hypothetical protein PHO76_00300 [Methylotenera sp.]|nr:hypothetical protein [Methylotenera sp.]MDD4925322.1 hypothetical protein [Methylotenera sp.]